MAMMKGFSAGSGGRRRHTMMSEINVTPMVDVMLVLLIIFMVSAPLLTVGVQVDLPQTKAKSLDLDKEPITISVNDNGKVARVMGRLQTAGFHRVALVTEVEQGS